MKKYLTIIVLCLAVTAKGQWLESNVFDEPLKDVLAKIELRYGVRVIYEDKNVKGKIVAKAPWKFYDEVEATLDNVLHPLDMRFDKKSDNVYEVKKWDYFRKPYEQGKKHLDKLLASCPDKASWEGRKRVLRENIVSVLGVDRLPKCELAPIKSNLRKYDGYSVENIALQVLPGVWVCGSMYMPSKVSGKIPAFLSPHGHFYSSVDTSIADERGRYRPDQQLRCAMLAKMGAAVFSYDMFGWGESTLAFNLKDHRTELGLIMQTIQSIRVLDYFTSLSYIDHERIGVTGASGGGSQVLFIAAIDDRVTLSVPTVMMSCHFYGGCPCESGLPIHFPKGVMESNNTEFAAMFAPKPMLVISDGNDWTSTVPEYDMPYLKKIYGYYGAQRSVENAHLPKDRHDYGLNKRYALYDFVSRSFGLKSSGLCSNGEWNESTVTIEPAVNMYVFRQGEYLPEGSVKGASNLRKLLKENNKN